MPPRKAPPTKKIPINPGTLLPSGTILQDSYNKKWVLGEPIPEKGAVGTFYISKPHNSKSNQWNHIIKIKPIDNGPLFIEMHFYKRCTKEPDVNKFKLGKNLTHLGLPRYVASGTHVHQNEKYRFILMEKFAERSVWSRFEENARKMPTPTAFRIALQMLDVLEYVHSKGYVHADIKGANIVLNAQDEARVHLVDFGLCAKFTTAPNFYPNIGRIPNASMEYVSRDAHQLVHTRRGDIEMLFFNLIHWLTGSLPWENLTNPQSIYQSKVENMKLYHTFWTGKPTEPLQTLQKYINDLSYKQRPDYEKVKRLISESMNDLERFDIGPLNFVTAQKREHPNPETSTIQKKRCKCDDGDYPCLGAPATNKTLEMLRIEALIRERQSKKKRPRKV